jgi:methionyl-tRNA formyltransferase
VVVRTVRLIAAGNAVPIPQDDRTATPAPKIFPADCRIDWARSPEEVRNFIRGMSPSPGAFTHHHGKTLKIYRSAAKNAGSVPAPGTVHCDGRTLRVAVQGGWVELLDLQLEGKKRLGVEEFLRGYRLASSDRFGD